MSICFLSCFDGSRAYYKLCKLIPERSVRSLSRVQGLGDNVMPHFESMPNRGRSPKSGDAIVTVWQVIG